MNAEAKVFLNDAIVTPKRNLLRGTVVAAIIAAIVLTVAVLPAEYGIDPTGAGAAMGLAKLYTPVEALPEKVGAPVAAPAATLPAGGSTVSAPGEQRAPTFSSKPTLAYRTDEMETRWPRGREGR